VWGMTWNGPEIRKTRVNQPVKSICHNTSAALFDVSAFGACTKRVRATQTLWGDRLRYEDATFALSCAHSALTPMTRLVSACNISNAGSASRAHAGFISLRLPRRSSAEPTLCVPLPRARVNRLPTIDSFTLQEQRNSMTYGRGGDQNAPSQSWIDKMSSQN
jgi:hypothetical protein